MIIQLIEGVLIFLIGACTGATAIYKIEARKLADIQHQFDNIKGRYAPFMDALIAIAYHVGDSAEDKARIAEKALFGIKDE